MSFNPYLFFSGNCKQAFEFYSEVFGVDAQVMTSGDVPDGVEPMQGAEPHHVMHASITLGDGLLMGSDDPTGDGGPKVGVAVTFTAPDPDEGQRVFQALSEGGQVFMEFEPTFFSKGFGSFLDRYGVNWMIDTEGDPNG